MTRRQDHDIAAFRQVPALVSYVRQGRCALFVGAGLSKPAGFPDWRGLMHALVKIVRQEVGVDGAAELLRLLRADRFADVADQCRELLGREDFTARLRTLLAIRAQPPRVTHRAIVATPYACVVTTNFDTLIEDAYRRWGDGIPKSPTGAELAEHGTLLLDGAFFVLKAHGTIHNATSMVFTTEDYQRIIHSNPAFQSVMSAVLLTHAVLFVGYSLNDPNFRLLMDSQLATFGAGMPPRYALMPDVGENERSILRRTAGIEVLSYDTSVHQHRPVGDLLAYVRDESLRETNGRRRAGSPVASRATVRPGRRVDALVIAMRGRGLGVDVRFFRTTSEDLSGAHLRLEQKWAVTAPAQIPWQDLESLLPAAVQFGPDALAQIAAAGTLLAALWPDELRQIIGRLPPHAVVVLDLAPEMRPLPWEWLMISEAPLARIRPTCRLMGGVSDAARGRPFPHAPLRALLIGDTRPLLEGRRVALRGARTEVREIAALLREHGAEVDVLVGRSATYARVLEHLLTNVYDLVHFAGHGSYDGGESYLALYDGRVYGSELVTLLNRRPPAVLALSTHFTGLVPVFVDTSMRIRPGMAFEDFYQRLGARSLGFEHAAARAGVGILVGTLSSPGDRGSLRCMRRFYRELLSGVPAALALFRARFERLAATDPTSLSFTLAGYPDLRLTADRR